jgi:hypothetical protein
VDLAGEVPEEGVDVIQRGDGGFFWRRFLGIGARRLPGGSGELLFQGDEGSLSGGAPPTALVVASVAELQMGWTVIFFFFWGPICNLSGLISVFSPAKKKETLWNYKRLA